MEALQKIKVFRAFDVFSLLACLQHLRFNGLQQVIFVCLASSLVQFAQCLLLVLEFLYVPQASVRGGSVKAVIVDSVSAVLSSMLGGKQNEGIVCWIAQYFIIF